MGMLDKIVSELVDGSATGPITLGEGLELRFWKRGQVQVLFFGREGQYPSEQEAHTLRQSVVRLYEMDTVITSTDTVKRVDPKRHTEWYFHSLVWLEGGCKVSTFEHVAKQKHLI